MSWVWWTIAVTAVAVAGLVVVEVRTRRRDKNTLYYHRVHWKDD